MSREKALASMQRGLDRVEPVRKSLASNVYFNVTSPGISVRDEFTREDYESFRNSERVPTDDKEIIQSCDKGYRHCGLVHNIIDLMADFAVQGIDICHPVEQTERFFKAWFKKVRGLNRSERFLNLLYRRANVIVKRETAFVPLGTYRDMRAKGNESAQASPDIDLRNQQEYKPDRREIPWSYTFLPLKNINLVDDELSTFVGEQGRMFTLSIPHGLARKIISPKTPDEVALINKLPADIVNNIRQGNRKILLDPDKVKAYYYKKDDEQPWATPMLYPVLVDLNILEKMKLADVAALDGAISNIRVWRLGSLEHEIIPSEQAILRLAEVLSNSVGGGVVDFVWGPDIELVETKTDIHNFLGSSKYEPVLNFIFHGLGIPPALTGSGKDGGFTNNFLSLKTLIERLEYGRSVLVEFWEHEIRQVQLALGITKPATITFDRMTLNDEATERKLLLDLADRDLISWEYLIERFGGVPEIEAVRLRREMRKRKSGKTPPKASPYHAAEKQHELKKIYTQSGAYAPSEMGVELEPKKSGEKSPQQLTPKPTPSAAPKGQPGQGRPKLSNDKTKRKQKVVKPRQSVKSPGKPRTRAELINHLSMAEQKLGQIASLINPVFLKTHGKNSLRELTDEQADVLERSKFALLFQFEPNSEVTSEAVGEILQGNSSLVVPVFAQKLYEKTVEQYRAKHAKEPGMETLRRFQSSTYAMWAMSRPKDF